MGYRMEPITCLISACKLAKRIVFKAWLVTLTPLGFFDIHPGRLVSRYYFRVLVFTYELCMLNISRSTFGIKRVRRFYGP